MGNHKNFRPSPHPVHVLIQQVLPKSPSIEAVHFRQCPRCSRGFHYGAHRYQTCKNKNEAATLLDDLIAKDTLFD